MNRAVASPQQFHAPCCGDDVIAWLDAVAEPIFVVQEKKGTVRLVHVNEALCQAVSLSRRTLLSRGLGAWLAADPLQRMGLAVRSALTTGRSRCREVDPSGAMVEFRRIRGRDGEYCLGTLRLPVGTSNAPLSRDELTHRADLLTTAMDLEAMVAWSWDLESDELCLEYRAAAAEFVPLSEPVLQSFFEQVHPDDRDRVDQAVREALDDGRIHQVEFRYLTPAGRQRWISSALKRFVDKQGQPAGLVGASRDVTRRRNVFQELADSAQRLRTVLDNEPACVKIVDRDYTLRMMNPAGLAMIGAQDAEQAIGRDVRDLLAPGHRAAFEAYHERIMQGATDMLTFEIVGLTGERRWVESHAAPLRNSAGEIVGHLGVTRDVTEQRRLSQALIDAANQEQERIGRDLHDGLGQDLTGIALMLKGLQGQLDRPAGAVAEDIEDIIGLVNRALHSTRSLARGLSPVALEQGGLAHALDDLVHRAREAGRLKARLTIRSEHVDRLERSVAVELYRIAQEALSNALRHANATRIEVGLRDTLHGLRLRIADDGHGMPSGADATPGPGLGLRTMQYRAQLVGASLVVQDGRHRGTAVTVTLPCPPEETAGA